MRANPEPDREGLSRMHEPAGIFEVEDIPVRIESHFLADRVELAFLFLF